MNPKPAIPKGEIRVYWWNLGRRQLEPYMTYATWFSAKGITVTNRAGIYIFKMSLSNTSVVIRRNWGFRHGEAERACDEAIICFMTLLGDKARIETPLGTYKVNW